MVQKEKSILSISHTADEITKDRENSIFGVESPRHLQAVAKQENYLLRNPEPKKDSRRKKTMNIFY